VTSTLFFLVSIQRSFMSREMRENGDPRATTSSVEAAMAI
jgi:hypothetical protein